MKISYIFFIFDTTATVIHELKTQIKLTQDIIRHMFIKIKEKEFDKNPSEMMKENQDEDR